MHLLDERDRAVPAGGLRLVERDVRVAQEIVGAGPVAHRDADACGNGQRCVGRALELVRLAEHVEQPLGDELRVVGKRPSLDDHDELVSALAPDGVHLAEGG